MDTVGERLRAERDRLQMTQDAFAAAMGCKKRALANYESGERSPDASLLGGAARVGADVLFIVTGQRTDGLLSAEEQTLLSYYRDAPAAVRRAAMGALVGGAQPGGMTMTQAGMTMTQSGGGVQVGHSSGPVTVGAPAPRKRKTG